MYVGKKNFFPSVMPFLEKERNAHNKLIVWKVTDKLMIWIPALNQVNLLDDFCKEKNCGKKSISFSSKNLRN